MKRQRSVLTLIAVPAVVSLVVTLIVLYFWDRQQEPESIILPTHSGTALIEPRDTLPSSAGGDDVTQEPDDSSVTEDGLGPGVAGCENPVHEVASGETLGQIAQQYGFSIDDLVTINQMLDPAFESDFLSVGQAIVIPECGIPTLTPSPEPSQTPVPTRNIPTPAPTATEPPPGLVLVEVARVLNPGDITSEAVEIINLGTSVARLAGWTLVNEDGDTFEFPPLNLFPQGAVTIYTGGGENTAIDVFWGRDEAAWEPGGVVLLYDAEGELQVEYVIED